MQDTGLWCAKCAVQSAVVYLIMYVDFATPTGGMLPNFATQTPLAQFVYVYAGIMLGESAFYQFGINSWKW